MIGADGLYRRLLDAHGAPRWWSDDPFTVMLQAVLVQRSTWRTVETTCAAFPARLTAEAAACLSGERLAQMIRPCGFAKAKARAIHALAAWFCRYGCDVRRTQDVPLEALRAQLLSLFGVGEETADVILVYALYRPSFIIDAYTRRLLARLGGNFSGDAALRRYFTCALPPDARLFGRYHWLILDHCTTLCRKTPACTACPLRDVCREGSPGLTPDNGTPS